MLALRRAFERAHSSVVPEARNGLWFRDDFINKNLSIFSVTAGGTNSAVGVSMGTNHPGMITQTVTAVGDGARIVGENSAMAALGLGSGETTVEFCGEIPTRSDGVNNIIVRAGFGDVTAVGDFVDGVYLEYDFATHADHNWRLCAAANSVRTKVNTGVAVTNGGDFRARITVAPNGLSAQVSFSGAPGAFVTSNLPFGVPRAFGYEIQTSKQLGAAALTANWDYIEVFQDTRGLR